MKTHVHNDTTCKSARKYQMPINNRMDKMWYIHAIDEHFTTTCNNMDLKHSAENHTYKNTYHLVLFILHKNWQN